VAAGRCRDHIKLTNMHIDHRKHAVMVYGLPIGHSLDTSEGKYGNGGYISVSFPVDLECVPNSTRLSYMYGDPAEIISSSIMSFYRPDSFRRISGDARKLLRHSGGCRQV